MATVAPRPPAAAGPPATADFPIVILGTGFAGLGLAIRSSRRACDDFVLLERAADVGGTWRDNTYPGCQCDVPSHLYSFSFAPEPGLDAARSRSSPRSGTTCATCADRFGVRPHIRFGHEVTGAPRGTRTPALWRVETSQGAAHRRRPGRRRRAA